MSFPHDLCYPMTIEGWTEFLRANNISIPPPMNVWACPDVQAGPSVTLTENTAPRYETADDRCERQAAKGRLPK